MHPLLREYPIRIDISNRITSFVAGGTDDIMLLNDKPEVMLILYIDFSTCLDLYLQVAIGLGYRPLLPVESSLSSNDDEHSDDLEPSRHEDKRTNELMSIHATPGYPVPEAAPDGREWLRQIFCEELEIRPKQVEKLLGTDMRSFHLILHHGIDGNIAAILGLFRSLLDQKAMFSSYFQTYPSDFKTLLELFGRGIESPFPPIVVFTIEILMCFTQLCDADDGVYISSNNIPDIQEQMKSDRSKWFFKSGMAGLVPALQNSSLRDDHTSMYHLFIALAGSKLHQAVGTRMQQLFSTDVQYIECLHELVLTLADVGTQGAPPWHATALQIMIEIGSRYASSPSFSSALRTASFCLLTDGWLLMISFITVSSTNATENAHTADSYEPWAGAEIKSMIQNLSRGLRDPSILIQSTVLCNVTHLLCSMLRQRSTTTHSTFLSSLSHRLFKVMIFFCLEHRAEPAHGLSLDMMQSILRHAKTIQLSIFLQPFLKSAYLQSYAHAELNVLGTMIHHPSLTSVEAQEIFQLLFQTGIPNPRMSTLAKTLMDAILDRFRDNDDFHARIIECVQAATKVLVNDPSPDHQLYIPVIHQMIHTRIHDPDIAQSILSKLDSVSMIVEAKRKKKEEGSRSQQRLHPSSSPVKAAAIWKVDQKSAPPLSPVPHPPTSVSKTSCPPDTNKHYDPEIIQLLDAKWKRPLHYAFKNYTHLGYQTAKPLFTEMKGDSKQVAFPGWIRFLHDYKFIPTCITTPDAKTLYQDLVRVSSSGTQLTFRGFVRGIAFLVDLLWSLATDDDHHDDHHDIDLVVQDKVTQFIQYMQNQASTSGHSRVLRQEDWLMTLEDMNLSTTPPAMILIPKPPRCSDIPTATTKIIVPKFEHVKQQKQQEENREYLKKQKEFERRRQECHDQLVSGSPRRRKSHGQRPSPVRILKPKPRASSQSPAKARRERHVGSSARSTHSHVHQTLSKKAKSPHRPSPADYRSFSEFQKLSSQSTKFKKNTRGDDPHPLLSSPSRRLNRFELKDPRLVHRCSTYGDHHHHPSNTPKSKTQEKKTRSSPVKSTTSPTTRSPTKQKVQQILHHRNKTTTTRLTVSPTTSETCSEYDRRERRKAALRKYQQTHMSSSRA